MTTHLIDSVAQRDRIIEQIRLLPVEKTRFEISIRPYRENRTTAQNRLMWFWLGYLEDQTGHTKEELHELFKAEILGMERKEMFGRSLSLPKSTKDMPVKDFIDYLTRMEALCASLGFILPAPHYYQEAMR